MRDELLRVIFDHIDDETVDLDTPELVEMWREYEDKWIKPVYSKEEYLQEEPELEELLFAYKKNAFKVGFDAALTLMQKDKSEEVSA